MSKKDSYLERRLLFKNVWENADVEQEGNKRRKVVNCFRTAKLEEDYRSIAKKKKEQRFKVLSKACNKILKICDQQDANVNFLPERKEQQNLAGGKKTSRKKQSHLVKRKHNSNKSIKRKYTRNIQATTNNLAEDDARVPETSSMENTIIARPLTIKSNFSSENLTPISDGNATQCKKYKLVRKKFVR